MTALKISATSSRQSSTATQPNSTTIWRFPTNLARVAASIGIAAAFVCVPAATRVLAQEAQPAEVKDTVDPDAVDALKKMGAYLKTLKSFQVIDDVTSDDVLEDGLIVQSTSKVDLSPRAARPHARRGHQR